MNYKNDVSFVCDFELMLYEHQSTVNPNMPLRDLIYVTTIFIYNINWGYNQELMKACRVLEEYAQYVDYVR